MWVSSSGLESSGFRGKLVQVVLDWALITGIVHVKTPRLLYSSLVWGT